MPATAQPLAKPGGLRIEKKKRKKRKKRNKKQQLKKSKKKKRKKPENLGPRGRVRRMGWSRS